MPAPFCPVSLPTFERNSSFYLFVSQALPARGHEKISFIGTSIPRPCAARNAEHLVEADLHAARDQTARWGRAGDLLGEDIPVRVELKEHGSDWLELDADTIDP